MTPSPLQSPRVPQDDVDTEGEKITGSYYIPATLHDVKAAKVELVAAAETRAAEVEVQTSKVITTANVKWFVASMSAVVVATASTITWANDQIDKRVALGVDAGLAPLRHQVEAVLAETRETRADTKETKAELREVRLDLKESYRANRYDRASPRLERPLPPLTAPDGGP